MREIIVVADVRIVDGVLTPVYVVERFDANGCFVSSEEINE